jgi:hypothetical protein
MTDDIFDGWLSLEKSEFVGNVYDMATPIHLGVKDYSELLSTEPEKAYIVDVHYRINMLVKRFESLNMIYKMIGVNQFPILSQRHSIIRQEWSKIILDVLLSRITSVRDCTYLLINDIFELGLNARDVSRRSLIDHLSIPVHPFNKFINDIADIGKDLRKERNLHMHEGEERELGEDPTTYFIASIFEGWGREISGNDQFGNPINLDENHRRVMEQIESDFTSNAIMLQNTLYDLFDELKPIFMNKIHEKRHTSP